MSTLVTSQFSESRSCRAAAPHIHPARKRGAHTILAMSLLAAVLGACSVDELPENPPAGQLNLPRTIAWSAYPTGTGGYSQAVAIGNIL
ncbi:MAG: hypothetical protein KKD00_01860, partial [Gammaproteobacteria bacterium]|nr:hypothetical protein [Gammaproteobacteria bacterium]